MRHPTLNTGSLHLSSLQNKSSLFSEGQTKQYNSRYTTYIPAALGSESALEVKTKLNLFEKPFKMKTDGASCFVIFSLFPKIFKFGIMQIRH